LPSFKDFDEPLATQMLLIIVHNLWNNRVVVLLQKRMSLHPNEKNYYFLNKITILSLKGWNYFWRGRRMWKWLVEDHLRAKQSRLWLKFISVASFVVFNKNSQPTILNLRDFLWSLWPNHQFLLQLCFKWKNFTSFMRPTWAKTNSFAHFFFLFIKLSFWRKPLFSLLFCQFTHTYINIFTSF
jgi:hypothetical protein